MADRRSARCRDDATSVYKVLNAMNESDLWTAEPHTAYLHWQTTEAAGADRRRFSQRSIVQHKAMFDRFLRHLLTRGVALATFGPEHLDSFFDDVENRCAPGTTTRLRYVKLIDRLCRHLVDVGLRHSNPAATFALSAAWPEDEPEPLFLDPDADAALQGYVQPDAGDDVMSYSRRFVVRCNVLTRPGLIGFTNTWLAPSVSTIHCTESPIAGSVVSRSPGASSIVVFFNGAVMIR